jgi:hypothetical protein
MTSQRLAKVVKDGVRCLLTMLFLRMIFLVRCINIKRYVFDIFIYIGYIIYYLKKGKKVEK